MWYIIYVQYNGDAGSGGGWRGGMLKRLVWYDIYTVHDKWVKWYVTYIQYKTHNSCHYDIYTIQRCSIHVCMYTHRYVYTGMCVISCLCKCVVTCLHMCVHTGGGGGWGGGILKRRIWYIYNTRQMSHVMMCDIYTIQRWCRQRRRIRRRHPQNVCTQYTANESCDIYIYTIQWWCRQRRKIMRKPCSSVTVLWKTPNARGWRLMTPWCKLNLMLRCANTLQHTATHYNTLQQASSNWCRGVRPTYERVMSHIWMSHVTRTNESCHTFEWVMSHICMCHVAHMKRKEADEALLQEVQLDAPATGKLILIPRCATYIWTTWHIRMSHVTHTNAPCHTYECVMSHIRMSHVTHTNESCHTYECVILHVWRGGSRMRPCCSCNLVLGCATWLIHLCNMTAIWLIHMCDMTHSHVCPDSFIYAPWLIHMCAMAHSYMRHVSFTCAPWLIHMCAMTHSYVRHDCNLTHSTCAELLSPSSTTTLNPRVPYSTCALSLFLSSTLIERNLSLSSTTTLIPRVS